MKTLRLCKGKSYAGIVRVSADKPVVTVTDATAAALLASGYFALEEEAAEETVDDPEVEAVPDYEALAAMTKAELTAYAKAREISISGCKTKADILMVISEHYGGCDTMIDLQRR